MLLNYRRERNLYIQQSSIHKPSTLPLFNMLSLQYCVFSLLFLYILTGVSCEELTPVKNEEYSLEGSTVTLSYRYSKQATNLDYFFWYRQYPGKPPEFFMYHSGTGAILDQRIPGLTIKVDQNLINMNISSAAVTDSAVYYCARATLSSRRCTTSALCSTIQSIRSAAVKRTILTLNVEHQLVSLVDLNLVVEMEHWLWIILAALFFGLIAGDKISPVQDEVSQREGQSVTLTCRYETDDNDILLHWYRHHSDLQAPQFILWKGARNYRGVDHIPDDKKYGSETSSDSTELTIKNLTLADTALYYCALETQ
ncbi:hypothetical protein ABVT39_009550 [Epinephelus coioides]